MSRKFERSLRKAVDFQDWLERLRRFNCALIKENRLQLWTIADFQNYYTKYKGAI